MSGAALGMQCVEAATTLTTPLQDWQTIATNFPPTSISNSFSYAVETNQIRFYRIRAER